VRCQQVDSAVAPWTVEEARGRSQQVESAVAMWTVEEDLLILSQVEHHGKQWCKIAALLPGRTGNGVRNRWNRMERAQALRARHCQGAQFGYRCGRCGQPKRGHICAALTLGNAPAGEELLAKAEAFSKMSAQRMCKSPAPDSPRAPAVCEAVSPEPAFTEPAFTEPAFTELAVVLCALRDGGSFKMCE